MILEKNEAEIDESDFSPTNSGTLKHPMKAPNNSPKVVF
jgi:hypothetical protein